MSSKRSKGAGSAKKAKPKKKAPGVKSGRFTPKERKFLDAYMRTRSLTDAALEAGLSPTENRASACVLGGKMLKQPRIIAEIERRLADTAQSLKDQRQPTIGSLVRIRDFNPAWLFKRKRNKDGSYTVDPKELEEANLEDWLNVADIVYKEFEGGHSLRIKPYNKLQALAQLGKMTGLVDQDLDDKSRSEDEVQKELDTFLDRMKDEDVIQAPSACDPSSPAEVGSQPDEASSPADSTIVEPPPDDAPPETAG